MESSTLANCDKHNKGQNEKGEKFRNQNVNYSVKKAKLKGKEEENVLIHKKQIDPTEHIRLVFPSFSNETINEVLQRTGNNIEQGIQILKGFVTENKDSVTTTNTKRRKRNYNEALNINSNSNDNNMEIYRVHHEIKNPLQKENPSLICHDDKEMSSSSEHDKNDSKDIIVNTEQISSPEPSPNSIQKSPEEPLATPNIVPQYEKDPIVEKFIDSTLEDLSKISSREELRKYLLNLLTSPSPQQKDIDDRKEISKNFIKKNKVLHSALVSKTNELLSLQKDNKDKEEKINELTSSILNYHDVLANEKVKRLHYEDRLKPYLQQEDQLIFPKEGY